MAHKHHETLDVWILESNTVYKQVPFAVVTDWVQQNRLLPEDRVRPAGSQDWHQIGNLPAFSAYTQKEEPPQANDTAEALEPVHTGIRWKRRSGDEDQDVDMIPLIDVSLVLLVFFMMLRLLSNAGAGSLIDTPKVEYKHVTVEPDMLWVGVKDDKNGASYFLGRGPEGRTDLQTGLSEQQLLTQLDAWLAEKPANVRVAADKTLPYETVQELTAQLEKRKPAQIRNIFAEVSEKEPS